MLTTVSSA